MHALFEISVQSQVNLHDLHLQRRGDLVLDFHLIDPNTLFVFRKKKRSLFRSNCKNVINS